MTATTSKLGADMNDPEMNTLVIQTATAAGLRVNVNGKMLNDNYTNVMGSFPSLVRFARALLARQPAAIGKDAFAEYRRGVKEAFHIANMIHANRQWRTAEETCSSIVRVLAEMVNSGEARAASTSANVAQDSKPITDLATIVKAAYGNKAWISRRDDIPNFLSPTSADYADLKAEGEKTSSWHPDFVVALYDNTDPDKRYTMDQMREYADAFHRSRIDAANVAQGAEEPDCWAILTPNGSRLVSPDEAKGRLDAYPLYTAPTAQTALRRIAHELRTYNPAADEYKGEHIHKVWAREIEALLPAASNGESK